MNYLEEQKKCWEINLSIFYISEKAYKVCL